MSEYYLGNSVVNSYIATENMLLDVLRVVPYCQEHMNVWSPKLVTVLLESCSQLDSLWKYEARKSAYTKRGNLSIEDYFMYFGEYIAPRWIVFYGVESTEKLEPFANWLQASNFQRGSFLKLTWWSAYNALKHDRFRNQKEATLSNAVQALGGLFLAILRCEPCRNAIAQTDWFLDEGNNILPWLGEDSLSVKEQYIAIESNLFTYAVGWGKEPLHPKMKWQGICSQRFRDWLELNTTA
jgi:hypothetical protein